MFSTSTVLEDRRKLMRWQPKQISCTLAGTSGPRLPPLRCKPVLNQPVLSPPHIRCKHVVKLYKCTLSAFSHHSLYTVQNDF